MIENLVLRWAMTLAFGWAGAAHLRGLVAEGALAHRLCEAAHVVMCAAMIAMAWPWGVLLPMWPQAGLFACAGAWFTAQCLVIVLGGALAMRVAAIPASHAVGMFSMVWMLVAMRGDDHHHTGHAAPDWPVGLPASLLGLLSVVVAGRWLVMAVAPGPDGRVCLHAYPAGHAVLSIGMATMLFSLR